MMGFNDLNIGVQNFLLFNHFYLLKWVVFIVLIFLSAYYLLVVWPNHKPTKFFTQAIFRGFFYVLSLGYLLSSPLTLLSLSPEVDFYSFYTIPLVFFGVGFSFLTLLVFLDFFRYGPLVLLQLAKVDVKDSNVKKIARDIENNKHFMRFSKNWDMKKSR